MIAELRSEFKFVIEEVQGVKAELTRRMDDTDADNAANFTDIRKILSYHSRLLEQNEERWKQNDGRWQQNDTRLDRIETKLVQHDERFDHIETKLQEHDSHFNRIEGKLDTVIGKVEEHDQILKQRSA